MNSQYQNRSSGMTLIETVLYVILFSILMATFIQYAYAIQIQNQKLIYEIQDSYN